MTQNQARPQSYEHWEPHDGQAALRNHITQTRADLGDTISELASRADVKARARQAMAQARTRARNAVRSKARVAAERTQGAALSGATSARHVADRMSRSPAMILAGGAAGALAGLGAYALLRRRLPLRLPRSLSMPAKLTVPTKLSMRAIRGRMR